MAASPHRTLVALGAALLALLVLALGAVSAWAYQDPGSGDGAGSVTAPGAVASSGGTNWALVVGIIIAAVVAAIVIGLIALRGRGRSQPVVATSSAEAPASLLTASAPHAQDQESEDLPKAA